MADTSHAPPLRRRLRRGVQGIVLLAFLASIWLAWPGGWLLRFDPLAAIATMLADRAWLWSLWPGLLVLASAVVFGRGFCGWVCPLGTSVDMADKLCAGASKRLSLQGIRHLSRALLLGLLVAAILGASWLLWVAPLALATRLYGLVLTPVASLAGEWGLALLRPLAGDFGWTSLQFAALPTPRYATLWFQVLFFLAMLGAGLLAPRLWCRRLCPAGALLGICGIRSQWRRGVTDDCIDCGQCQRRCPMDAIHANPRHTRTQDCIACERCVQVCPVRAVSFGMGQDSANSSPRQFGGDRGPGARRWFLTGAAAGVGSAMLARLELSAPFPKAAVAQGVGELPHPIAIRPPGALPEASFLARCIRCGLCMAACPTNTLQPIAGEAGAAGMFSPVITPRRGPCDPDCRRCMLVCPTHALRPLPLPEKQVVKVGTARVLRQRCLAWEEDKACLVCDEVCPYDAIELLRQPGLRVAVPIVHEERCAGCGFCEYHCPVRAERAIVVDPGGAVRLAEGSYQEANQALGLDIKLAIHRPPPEHTKALGHRHGALSPYGAGDPSGDAPSSGGAADTLPPGFSDPNE